MFSVLENPLVSLSAEAQVDELWQCLCTEVRIPNRDFIVFTMLLTYCGAEAPQPKLPFLVLRRAW
jgi:hypothetical protein